MKKLTLIGVAMLLVIGGTQTFASADPALPSTPVPSSSCSPAAQVFNVKHWRRAHPAAGRQVCPVSARRLSELKQRFSDYRLYRHVATYPGGQHFGHGPPSPADGRWWAKPWQVICGESGGDFYVNADGGYQIIPGTWAAYGGRRYSSTAGEATPLEQHIIAHRAARAGTAWYGYSTAC